MNASDHVRQKGARLLHAGRVREVTPSRTFVVEGDSGHYLVTVSGDAWACDCQAYVTYCSHVEAVRLLIGGERAEPPTTLRAAHQASTPAPRTEGRLYTGSWRHLAVYERAALVPVRTSLGLPKWLPDTGARSYEYMVELAPVGGLFHVEDPAEFRAGYRERLDSVGVERIERRFQGIAQQHDGRPLVLLCFENDPRDCHRGDFAGWWLERTGELVAEFRSPQDR